MELQEDTAVQVNDDDVVAVAVVAVVAVDESSFLAHDPISATIPTIKTIQNSNFFIITSLHYWKMQDYSYIFVPGMVLTNTEITPHFT